jgi:hypothetical protein
MLHKLCIVPFVTIDASNPISKWRKWLISYYKINGIIALTKHVDVDHFFIAKIYMRRKWTTLWEKNGKTTKKKKLNGVENVTSNFFVMKNPFKKKVV